MQWKYYRINKNNNIEKSSIVSIKKKNKKKIKLKICKIYMQNVYKKFIIIFIIFINIILIIHKFIILYIIYIYYNFTFTIFKKNISFFYNEKIFFINYILIV